MLNYLNVLLKHFAIERTMNSKLRLILSQSGKCQSRRALLYFLGQQFPRVAALWENTPAEVEVIPHPGRCSPDMQARCVMSLVLESWVSPGTHTLSNGQHQEATNTSQLWREICSNKSWQMRIAQSEHNEGCPGFHLPCRLLLYHACSSLSHTTKETSLLHLPFSCYSTYFLINTINKPPVDHNISGFFTYHSLESP